MKSLVYILDLCHHRAQVCFVLTLRVGVMLLRLNGTLHRHDYLVSTLTVPLRIMCIFKLMLEKDSKVDELRVDIDASGDSYNLPSRLLAMPCDAYRDQNGHWKTQNVRVYVQAPHLFMQAVSYVIVHVDQRMRIKPLQQLLVHDKHTTTLYARPHRSWSDTSEPARQTLGPIDDSQAFNDGFRF